MTIKVLSAVLILNQLLWDALQSVILHGGNVNTILLQCECRGLNEELGVWYSIYPDRQACWKITFVHGFHWVRYSVCLLWACVAAFFFHVPPQNKSGSSSQSENEYNFTYSGANAVEPVNANIAQQFRLTCTSGAHQPPEATQGLHKACCFKLNLSITEPLDCIGVHTMISMSRLLWKIGFAQ